MPSPSAEGAEADGESEQFLVTRLRVDKEGALRAKASRLAAVLRVAKEVLNEGQPSTLRREGVDSTLLENSEADGASSDTIDGRNEKGNENVSAGSLHGRDSVGPAASPLTGSSALKADKRPRQPQPSISAPDMSAIASFIVDLTPRLTDVVAVNGPAAIQPALLEDIEDISRRLFIASFHATGRTARAASSPTSLATTGSQMKRLKKWGPQKARPDTNRGTVPQSTGLSDITFRAYAAVLALLVTRQQRMADSQQSHEALEAIKLSLDKSMAKLHYLNVSSAVAKQRQGTSDEVRAPAKELFSLWLTIRYLASKVENHAVTTLSKETRMPKLPAELGLLIGLSHSSAHGEIWKQSQNALAASPQDRSKAGAATPTIDPVAYRGFLRAFEVHGLTYSWKELSGKLQELLKSNELQAFSALWDDTVHLLRRGRQLEASGQAEKIESALATERKFASRATRSAYISACLTAILRNGGAEAIVEANVPVRSLVNEMVSTYGSPHSSEICQGILLLREKGLMNQDTMKSLTLSERAVFIGQNVRGYWANLSPEGVQKEIPLYSDYIRILGHYDDFNGLVDVWEEMRVDVGCETRHKAACESRNEGRMIAFSYPPTSLFNLFISVLLHNKHRVANSQKLAMDMFDYLQNPASTTKPNLETMNIMIRHHCKKLDIPSVMKVLTRISELGLKADVVTYTTVVQCFLDSGRRADAWKIIDAMDAEGVKRNQYLWSKIIAETARSGDEHDLREAERALVEMRKDGFEPNVVTWTGLIGGYFRGGYDKQAVDRLERMVAKGIRLNTVTCNMILRGCMSIANNASDSSRDKPLNPRIAFNILANMRKNGARPDEDTWYLLLHGFVMHGMMEEASLIVDEMDKAGFVVPREGGLARALRSVAGWRRSRERR